MALAVAPFSVFTVLVWQRLVRLAGPVQPGWPQKVHQSGGGQVGPKALAVITSKTAAHADRSLMSQPA
jgi:hypothetical protein